MTLTFDPIPIVDKGDIPEVKAAIREGLLEFNAPYLGVKWDAIPFAIYVKDTQGDTIGGIIGDVLNEIIRIDYTWVHPSFRGHGIGRRIFKALDDFALSEGVVAIHLDTADFQARSFYEKQGFGLVATLPQWIRGHDFYILRKRLSGAAKLSIG